MIMSGETPPVRASTSSLVISVISLQRKGVSGKFLVNVFSQFSSISDANIERTPAYSNPFVIPPQPENKSIDVNSFGASSFEFKRSFNTSINLGPFCGGFASVSSSSIESCGSLLCFLGLAIF